MSELKFKKITGEVLSSERVVSNTIRTTGKETTVKEEFKQDIFIKEDNGKELLITLEKEFPLRAGQRITLLSANYKNGIWLNVGIYNHNTETLKQLHTGLESNQLRVTHYTSRFSRILIGLFYSVLYAFIVGIPANILAELLDDQKNIVFQIIVFILAGVAFGIGFNKHVIQGVRKKRYGVSEFKKDIEKQFLA